MSGAPRRRIAAGGGEDPGQTIRFAIVALCVLGTACAYAACIVLVMGGHLEVLLRLLPWLAAGAVGTILVVTITAIVEAGHERLGSRRRLTAERIRKLAQEIHALEPAERDRAELKLVKRLDLTRDALRQILEHDPGVRDQLLCGGLAERVGHELTTARNRWHRVAAAGVLGLLQSESSITPLKRALNDRDADVAYAAAQALAAYSSAEAYAALLFALTKDRLPAARIAGLLEAFRCPEARELIERRAESENPRVRYWVAYLLGCLADQRSAPVIELLAQDPDEDVRANAAESLASFPNELLLYRLLDDESWVVRSRAAKAAGAARLEGLAPRLAELLEDRSWGVRQNAMLALTRLGAEAVPSLLAQLHSDDRFARNKAAEALIRTGYAGERIDRLAREEGQAAAAYRFLVDLGRAEAVGTIETAARTAADPEVRGRLEMVLEEIRSSPVEPDRQLVAA